MRFLSIITLVLLCTSVYALKPVAQSPLATPSTYCDESGVWKQYDNRVIDLRDGRIQSVSQLSEGPFSGTPEQIAREFLYKHQDWVGYLPSESTLKVTRVAETPIGSHITFELMIGDVPAYPSDIVVTINRENKVIFYYSSLYRMPLDIKISASLSAKQAIDIAMAHLNPQAPATSEPQAKLVIWAGDNRDFAVCWRVWQYLSKPMGDWEVIVDANTGQIRRVHDQACYVNGTGSIYRPDPLTQAQAVYGTGGYTDNSDANSADLQSQVVIDTLFDITLSSGTYSLQGPCVRLLDFESPTGAPVTATSADGFVYTRDQQGFEDVNAYYHISTSQRWIQSLGFTNIQNNPSDIIECDPHGLSGADNSHFIPSTNQLAFGEGGVDDAEDADVIWHEYGHGIQSSSVPGWGGGDEGGMGEGFGDYWAASHSRALNNFRNEWVFNWDGHNPFWDGRVVNGNRHYPEDNGEVHAAGEIWSQPNYECMVDIGRPIMDRIVLQHHFLLGTSASMLTAAQAIVTTDLNLYGGAHQATIYMHFIPRGLLTAPPAFALTSPNGGDLWVIDSTATVSWSIGSVTGNVSIELSRNGTAGPWQMLLASTPNDGAQSLVVPGPYSAHCRVRVSSLSVPDTTDISNADFTVSALSLLVNEGFESGAADWTHSGAGGTWIDQWHVSTEQFHSGTHAYKCGDTGTGNYGNYNDARLLSPVLNNLPATSKMKFYHQMQSEISGAYTDSAYDGGILEISANGGAFTQIASISGYNKTFRRSRGSGGAATGPMPGLPCYGGDIAWTQQEVDLSTYAGQSIQLRFRFGSDQSTGREGWYIDDLLIYAPAGPGLVAPTNLTITSIGSDIVLDWPNDNNPFYKIYSSDDPEDTVGTLVGTTDQHNYVIPGGAANEKKFYFVVGWDGN